MNDPHKSGGTLAAIIAIVAMILGCVLAGCLSLAYWEYAVQKQAARARAIKVLNQIEAREAARRASETSAELTENQ